MVDKDKIQKFIFENLGIRGEIVRLTDSWQEVLKRHDYPTTIRNVLGQMIAASTLLSSTLKFDGSLIMQIQGKGALRLAMAECSSDKAIRGIAQFEDPDPNESLLELTGNGILAITLDPKKGERYQGIVDLSSGDFVKSLEDYMDRSQQLTTWLWLYADKEQCAGMLLQKLPEDINQIKTFPPVTDQDSWSRVVTLAKTITRKEMQSLSFQNIIHRLFNEEDVRIFNPEPVSFNCSCTRDRVRNMLRMLGYEEVYAALEQEEVLGISCEFCNKKYKFDRVDVKELFASDQQFKHSSTRH